MNFDPGYGETPLPFDEIDALRPGAREALGDRITKAAVYDLEQDIEASVAEELFTEVLDGRITVRDLLAPGFLRDLHERLYGNIWQWAGQNRRHLLNIGVDPGYVAIELRTAIETIRYRWEHTADWTSRELGIAMHAECVRIHPFVDGNGRSTRLYADLLFLAAQDSDDIELYDWTFDKAEYIRLLREYDQHRDPRPLAAFIPTHQP